MNFLPIVNHSLAYNRSIDGLRGIAILLVLLFHIYPKQFSFGYVGVDIFFVLSGFLITQIISTKMQNKTFSFIEFYRNRIRRIFPAMIIVLLAAFILGYLFLFPSELIELAKHIKSSSLFTQNFMLIKEVGYWDVQSTIKPLLHFWSLSIEEQFYIFWPIAIWLIYRFNLNILTSLFFIFMALLILPQFLDIDPFYNSLSRFWELSLGGLAFAFLGKHKSINISKLSNFIIALFFVAIMIGYGNNVYSLTKTIFITLATAFLIVLLVKNPNHKIFSNKILFFFGLISFPLYLWHYMLIGYANIFGYDGLDTKFILAFISIALSYLTYIFIEIRARKQNSYKFMMFLLTIVIVIVFGVTYIKKSLGLPQREHLSGIKIQSPRPATSNSDGLKLVKAILDKNSSIDQVKSNTTKIDSNLVIMIGDSHSYASYDGMSEELLKYGYNTLNISNNSSPAFIDVTIADSKQALKMKMKKNKEVYKIIEVIKPKHVIYIARMANYIEPTSKYYVYKNDIQVIDKKESAYFAEVEKVFAYFNARNIKLDYILENPELDFNPDTCMARPFGIGKVRKCKISLASYIKQNQKYNNEIYKIALKYPNVKIHDPQSAFCDTQYCYALKDGKILYFDENHLNLEGSRVQAKKLIGEIVGKKK